MFNNCKIFVKLAYYTQSRIRNSHRESMSDIQINHMASLIIGLPNKCVILFLLSENEGEHSRLILYENHMSHLLMLGKFEYGGGPIFKVVIEC